MNRHIVLIDEGGRVQLPADLLAELGWNPGERVALGAADSHLIGCATNVGCTPEELATVMAKLRERYGEVLRRLAQG